MIFKVVLAESGRCRKVVDARKTCRQINVTPQEINAWRPCIWPILMF